MINPLALLENPKLVVTIGDNEYTEFQSLSITKNVESIAGSFNISFAGVDPEIEIESEVEITYNDENVFSGFVEVIDSELTESGVNYKYSGRSNCGQLVGTSIEKAVEFKNKKADFIINQVLAPFDIKAVFDADAGDKIKKFSVEPSEDPASVIKKLVNMRKLLAYDDAGELLIAKSGDERSGATLSSGRYLAKKTTNVTNVYSNYTVIGNSNKIKAEALNNNINRYRPKIIVSSNKIDQATAQNRAEWQKQKDEGKKTTISVSGQGWLDDQGNILRINSIVSLDFLEINLAGNYLIQNITYNYSNSGTQIDMSLVNEDTYK